MKRWKLLESSPERRLLSPKVEALRSYPLLPDTHPNAESSVENTHACRTTARTSAGAPISRYHRLAVALRPPALLPGGHAVRHCQRLLRADVQQDGGLQAGDRPLDQ